jgi:hypothetical protein
MLEQRVNQRTKDWWENYVKQGAPFMGVMMAEIHEIMHKWHADYLSDQLGPSQQVELAMALILREFSEKQTLHEGDAEGAVDRLIPNISTRDHQASFVMFHPH